MIEQWYARDVNHGVARHSIFVRKGLVAQEEYKGMGGVEVVPDAPTMVGSPLSAIHSWRFKKVGGMQLWDSYKGAWYSAGARFGTDELDHEEEGLKD